MMGIPVLLLALAAGYWVLTLSSAQPKPLNTLGRVVGGIILLVAIAGLICAAVCGMCKKSCGMRGMSSCSMGAKMDCPMSKAPAAPVADAQ